MRGRKKEMESEKKIGRERERLEERERTLCNVSKAYKELFCARMKFYASIVKIPFKIMLPCFISSVVWCRIVYVASKV